MVKEIITMDVFLMNNTFTKCLEEFEFNMFENFHDHYLKKDVFIIS